VTLSYNRTRWNAGMLQIAMRIRRVRLHGGRSGRWRKRNRQILPGEPRPRALPNSNCGFAPFQSSIHSRTMGLGYERNHADPWSAGAELSARRPKSNQAVARRVQWIEDGCEVSHAVQRLLRVLQHCSCTAMVYVRLTQQGDPAFRKSAGFSSKSDLREKDPLARKIAHHEVICEWVAVITAAAK
jgi:hypothetical protein